MEVSASRTRQRQVQRLFAEVVGLDKSEREARLDRACEDDPSLRDEVEALLHRRAGRAGAPFRSAPGESLVLGEIVGHYCLLEELGRGAMGVVYRAEDTRLKRSVALKFLAPGLGTDRKARARLEREAQAASALDHPNICTVYEIGETDDGRLFLALACYDGETLQHCIERGPLPADEAVRIAIHMARGLAAAHRHGIVHRDVKPSNVLVTEDGSVKILDFGIARVAGSDLTGSSDTLGTAAYMAPEHLRGEPDARSDLWALGVTLYEMLTGTRPFVGDYEAALLYAVLNEDPAPLPKKVPEELRAIVERCLEKDPELRYQSAEEVEVDLERLRVGDPSTVPPHRLSRRIRRLALGLGALALLLVLLSPIRTVLTDAMGLDGVPDEKRIAVLPFSVAGTDPSAEAFSNGLVEILASTLTQLEQFGGKLWVVPTSEMRGREITSADEARRVFGVNLVVTGSVHRDASRVRSTLNLIDAASLRQLRSEVNDVPVDQLDALQNEIVGDLEAMLGLELGAAPRRALVAGSTSNPEAYDDYLQGFGYLQRYESAENIDIAIRLFERALEEDPTYALAHAGLGEAYWRRYEETKDVQWVALAEEHSQRALDLDDQLAPVHVTLGLIYTGTGRSGDAVREFRRALEVEPTSATAYRGLARAYEEQGHIEEAEATYRRAIELRPDYWGGHNDLGGFYFALGRPEEAIESFRRVTELAPENAWGYLNLGGVYDFLGRRGEAIEMYERSLEIARSSDAYSNLGTLYYYDGRYADAAAAYERALEINDQNYRIWGNLGWSYVWTPGTQDQATEAFRQAAQRGETQRLATDPDNPGVLAELAVYYAKLGERDLALDRVGQAQRRAPEDGDVLYEAAYAYELLGMREKALDRLEVALQNGLSLDRVLRDPGLSDLRADPRFQRIARPPANRRD